TTIVVAGALLGPSYPVGSCSPAEEEVLARLRVSPRRVDASPSWKDLEGQMSRPAEHKSPARRWQSISLDRGRKSAPKCPESRLRHWPERFRRTDYQIAQLH